MKIIFILHGLEGAPNRNLEKIFFGKVDNKGKRAIDYWLKFQYNEINHDYLQDFARYLVLQKLRTPKGLDWILSQSKTKNKDKILEWLPFLENMFLSVWAESVWQFADASCSDTKFIVSDHPVTVYNHSCSPKSILCKDFNDPDIRMHASHTIFPLNNEKILILTNQSWSIGPYLNAREYRDNASYGRDSLFDFTEIQTDRKLSEEEVIQINFVLKNRAYKYIAAEKEEWLYPEKQIIDLKWSRLGKGYLFMPDPRDLPIGTEIIIDGKTRDHQGRSPNDPNFGIKKAFDDFGNNWERWKSEFSHLEGPKRRGIIFDPRGVPIKRSSPEYHQKLLRKTPKPNPLNRIY